MNVMDLVDALDLPAGACVGQRVPKKLLVENGASTAADKRQINEGIEQIQWIAALKPATIGVPEYRDEIREYLEIAVLGLMLRPGVRGARLMALVHRAVPYPVWLVTIQASRPSLSLAHKRWSQSEVNTMVLDGEVIDAGLDDEVDEDLRHAFMTALPLANQPRESLYALYQGWIDTVLALQAARLTGQFALTTTAERAAARRAGLQECRQLKAEISRLRAAAGKERQLARQVELNLARQRAQARLDAAMADL